VGLSVYVFTNPTGLYGKIAFSSVSTLEYNSVAESQDREPFAEPVQEMNAGPSPEFISDFIPHLKTLWKPPGLTDVKE